MIGKQKIELCHKDSKVAIIVSYSMEEFVSTFCNRYQYYSISHQDVLRMVDIYVRGVKMIIGSDSYIEFVENFIKEKISHSISNKVVENSLKHHPHPTHNYSKESFKGRSVNYIKFYFTLLQKHKSIFVISPAISSSVIEMVALENKIKILDNIRYTTFVAGDEVDVAMLVMSNPECRIIDRIDISEDFQSWDTKDDYLHM